ncbi:MAG: DUF397 domain-containing protein [Patescibacteria group bacterium]
MKSDGKFRKSTFSRIITWCVEVAQDGETIRVRDSKNKNGAVLLFNKNEWDAFVRGVKAGEFDPSK